MPFVSEISSFLSQIAQAADPNRGPLLAILTQDASVSPHTIEFLLQNNAKAAAADEKGQFKKKKTTCGRSKFTFSSLGWTALHYAAKFDNAPAAAVLLRYNAPVGQETDDKRTPAAIAAQSSSHAVARILGSTLSHSVALAEMYVPIV